MERKDQDQSADFLEKRGKAPIDENSKEAQESLFGVWCFQDLRPFTLSPARMYVTSCSEQWGVCDSVVLPSKAAFSNLKLSCPGAKLFVFQREDRKRDRDRQRQREGENMNVCVRDRDTETERQRDP